MADGQGTALLRGVTSSPRATFLELFFDLVFVFALTRVSKRLIDDVSVDPPDVLRQVAQTVVLFLALWMVWILTARVTSRYEPERNPIQFVVVASMFASMVMAVALPRAFAERALPFALAYVAIQVGRPLLLTLALRGHPRRSVTRRILLWFVVGAVPWLLGALLPSAQEVLWTLALAWDYAGLALGWPMPRRGATRTSGWAVAGEHLAERYQQFFLIALGETVLIIGLTFSGAVYSARAALAFALSFLTTALLWRIYFHRAGHVLAEAIRVARSPGVLGESASWTHLVIVAGVLLTGVGYELVISHPQGRTPMGWAVFVTGGPALFLAARARFEYEIFARVSRSRVIGVVLLLGLLPLAPLLPPVGLLGLSAAVLIGIAAADTARAHGRPLERPASPL
ncbi:Low temperature requirement protein LtrA [Micromonospora purpureochromogenes]|uniref:Low temperature requirement protein LtrA n=1 Tax=Micromonospora purpureochromogenes TaxID=47872 RepID=A0A1C4ZYD0_9ACTN|nr:low temperature requirement protein A [Micromonospora purpureochromogenes]SCF37754.1 Low temperature requirement protein LtrA [Micromonospora purpureochromogenes]